MNGTAETRSDKAETLALTLRLLGVRRDAVMVGDRYSDIAAAHACGVPAVGVTWGYGSAVELRDAGADWLIDEPAELMELAALR